MSSGRYSWLVQEDLKDSCDKRLGAQGRRERTDKPVGRVSASYRGVQPKLSRPTVVQKRNSSGKLSSIFHHVAGLYVEHLHEFLAVVIKVTVLTTLLALSC